MSLWHENNLKENKNNDKFPDLPELEPLPELDDLFDDFDSGGLLPEENKVEVPEENIEVSEQQQHEDELPREIIDNTSESSIADEVEEPSESRITELPNIDLDIHEDDDDYEEHEEEEFEEKNSEGHEEESEEEFQHYDEEDLDAPDMNFEAFQTIDEIEVHNPEYDKTNDDEILNAENEEDPYGYDLGSEGFQGSLLPGVDLDENEKRQEEENEYEYEAESEEDTHEPPKEKAKNEPGFKELDEEKIKTFFMGLIAKFKGNKDKDNKIKKDNKPKRKTKDEKSPMKIDKTKIIYIGIAVGIVALLIAAYFMWGNSYDELNDIETTTQITSEHEDDIDINLSNMLVNEDGNLEIDIVNDGDISQNFSMYFTLKGKPLVPLLDDSIDCDSDIIIIEPGDKVNEILTCTGEIMKDVNYKVLDVEIDKF